jgi:hypothetical protein
VEKGPLELERQELTPKKAPEQLARLADDSTGVTSFTRGRGDVEGDDGEGDEGMESA